MPSKKQPQRMMFVGQDYLPYETEAVSKLKAHL